MNRRTLSSPISFLVFASIGLIAIPIAAGSSSRPSAANGKILGQVLLSPMCPVERIPPDPGCAPKPYKTKVDILKASNGALYKEITSNSLGKFSISLQTGSYVVRATSGRVYPRCSDVNVRVTSKKTVSIKVDCDTGIR